MLYISEVIKNYDHNHCQIYNNMQIVTSVNYNSESLFQLFEAFHQSDAVHECMNSHSLATHIVMGKKDLCH